MNVYLFSIGTGSYTVQLAQGLSVKDQVAAALWESEYQELLKDFPFFFQKAAFEVDKIKRYKMADLRKISLIISLITKIRRRRPDLIHAVMSGMSLESWLALSILSKLGIPMVATLHDTKLHPGDHVELRHIWFQFKILELCSQYIVHGHSMADDLLKQYGYDERVINVIPHGNYNIYFHTGGPGPEERPVPSRVLFFGRMKKYKGLSVLMEAAPIVAKEIPDLKIVVAGRGDDLDRHEPEMERQPWFEVHNRFIPSKEVSGLFASASLVVIPYIEASQSGPLHQAYSYGRPVVATRVGAIPESLTHEREGLLVEPGNPGELAEAMIRLLKDPDLAERLGQAGRQKTRAELDWQGAIADHTRSVYQKALAMKRDGISYPGISSKERWNRIKTFYYQANQ